MKKSQYRSVSMDTEDRNEKNEFDQVIQNRKKIRQVSGTPCQETEEQCLKTFKKSKCYLNILYLAKQVKKKQQANNFKYQEVGNTVPLKNLLGDTSVINR